MPINARFGRPQAIIVPGGSESIGTAEGLKSIEKLGEVFRQRGIDRRNEEILRNYGLPDNVVSKLDSAALSKGAQAVLGNMLQNRQGKKDSLTLEKAGFSRDLIDQLSNEQKAISVQQLVKNRVQRDEDDLTRKRQGEAGQKALSIYQKLREREAAKQDIPLNYQFGGKTLTDFERSQTLEPLDSGEMEISHDSSGNITVEGPTTNVTAAMDKGRETVPAGKVGDHVPPLSGIELLAQVLQGNAGLTQKEIENRGEDGIFALTPGESTLVQSKANPFFQRLISLAGTSSSGKVEIAGQILNTSRDPISGLTSVTGLSDENSKNLKLQFVPNPEDPSKRPVQAFINPRTNELNYVKDKKGGFVDKPLKDPVNIQISEKVKLKTLKDLKDEHNVALENLRTFQEIKQNYNPDYMTAFGQNVKLPLSRIMSKYFQANPLDPNFGFLTGATNFFQSVDQAFFLYRKFITGVAGGEVEMKRIEDAYINRNQSPVEFEAAMNRMHDLYNKTEKIIRRTTELVESGQFSLSAAQKYREQQVRSLLKSNGFSINKKKKSSLDIAVDALSKGLGE